MLLLKSSVCNIKKSKFLKEQEASVLLSNLFGGIVPFFKSGLPITNGLL